MMSIAYIYLLFYLEIDEQFGIAAKIEAENAPFAARFYLLNRFKIPVSGYEGF